MSDKSPQPFSGRQDGRQDFLLELSRESDRSAAILAASMLEYTIKEVLSAYLIDRKETKSLMSEPFAPLNTFSGCIGLAYALGLIAPDEYDDLHTIRKIRNDFAHKFELDFSFKDNRISDLSSKLKNAIVASPDGANPARYSFQVAITVLVVRLETRAEQVEAQRLTQGKWLSLEDLEIGNIPREGEEQLLFPARPDSN